MDSKTQKNVLIVEDDLFNRLLFKKTLEQSYNIFATGDFGEALELVKNNKINLLIIDINLPGKLSGIELLSEIRKFEGYEKTPAIAVTAYISYFPSSFCLDLGFDYYIEKPFDIRRFKQLVDFALSTGNLSQD